MLVRNRLSKKIESALNAQLTKEAHAAQIYLSFGAWAHQKGLPGIGNFLFIHSQEERKHMMKIVSYIIKRGGEVNIISIPAPPECPKDLNCCFEKIFEYEVDNTTAIYKLANMSLDEKDWATWDFMQWFIKEQVEEETLAIDILDKMKIAVSSHNNALYELDKDLGKVTNEPKSTENPLT